jgi:hypothetical protein
MREDGLTLKFIPSKEGLYYYNFNQSMMRKPAIAMMINTVEDVKQNFTKIEIEAADQARKLYVIMGRPSRRIFMRMY